MKGKRIRTTLGVALPLQYGKAKTADAGLERESTAIYGSSGCFGHHNKALTSGPTIVIGRKGAAGMVHYSSDPCWPTDTTYFSTGNEAVHLPFFRYLLESLQLDRLDRSTAIPSLSRDDYNPIQCEFPEDIDEQIAVCGQIDLQFSRLDAGIAALKRAQANLKRYRASVLQAAATGRLVPTEHDLAQAEGRDYETGEQLLQRILTERRRTWSGKRKYKEPVSVSVKSWPKVPDGWTYATVSELGIIGEQAVLTGPFGSSLGRTDFRASGVPVLTIGCLQDSGIELRKAMFVPDAKAQTLERYRLRAGDLLFSRMASVGRAGIVSNALSGSLFNYHIMRLRLEPTVLLSAYYLTYVRGAEQVRRYLLEVNHGATRDGINTEELLEMPVALPPLSEQARIVEEVERRLSVADRLEATLEANVHRATRLRQAILKKAFQRPSSDIT